MRDGDAAPLARRAGRWPASRPGLGRYTPLRGSCKRVEHNQSWYDRPTSGSAHLHPVSVAKHGMSSVRSEQIQAIIAVMLLVSIYRAEAL